MVSLTSMYAPTLTSATKVKDRSYNDLNFMGQVGVGKMNENGQCLLGFCCHHNICITYTFFYTKPKQKVSWRHRTSKHWHQLDLVITRRSDLGSVKLTCTFQSAVCDTDHSLLVCKVELQPKKTHRKKKEGRQRINSRMICNPEKLPEFIEALEDALPGSPLENAKERW